MLAATIVLRLRGAVDRGARDVDTTSTIGGRRTGDYSLSLSLSPFDVSLSARRNPKLALQSEEVEAKVEGRVVPGLFDQMHDPRFLPFLTSHVTGIIKRVLAQVVGWGEW